MSTKQRTFRFSPEVETFLASKIKRKGDLTKIVEDCIRWYAVGHKKSRVEFFSDNQILIKQVVSQFTDIAITIGSVQVTPSKDGFEVSLSAEISDAIGFATLVSSLVAVRVQQLSFLFNPKHQP